MPRSAQVILASTMVGLLIAVTWLGAPLIPAAVGALAAAAVLYLRLRQSADHRDGGSNLPRG